MLHVARLFPKSRSEQRLDEWCRTAVHDRRLGGIERNLDVVDSAARDRRKHVLHGVHCKRLFTELCAPIRQHCTLSERRNGRRPRQIGTTKTDPGAAWRRMK